MRRIVIWQRTLARAAALALASVLVVAASTAGAFAAEEENAINTHQVPDSSFLYDTSIAELTSAESFMDAKTVQVKGEAVGDVIYADASGEHCWLTLSAMADDDDSTVEVYLSETAAKGIDTLGSYGRQGTILQVRGTFHLACSEHQGISDIHAESVTVVQEGITAEEEFDLADFLPGLLMVGIGAALFALYRHLKEMRR